MSKSSKATYGQFCPLAMAAEFLCTRWTVLVLREMIFGSTSFNDISRGVPRMSRTLLSKRLKELTDIGVISKTRENSEQSAYRLTPSGEALRPVIFGLADWSQEWLRAEPALEKVDADLLMWNIRRHAKPHHELPESFVVHFVLDDQPAKRRNSWLVFEGDTVELCVIDRDFEPDVQVQSTTVVLTSVWMGWADFDQEVGAGRLVFHGPREITRLAKHWLGHSRLASIEKQAPELLVC